MACQMVEKLYDKGINKDEIAFHIEGQFGFSKRFVDRRIKTLKELDKFKEVEDDIKK
jgi:hypothetical protein